MKLLLAQNEIAPRSICGVITRHFWVGVLLTDTIAEIAPVANWTAELVSLQ